MAKQNVTGKASGFTFKSIKLPVTKYSQKVTRKLVDNTDSENYDAPTDMLHDAQIPVRLGTEISAEGYFDKNSTNARIIAELYSGNAAGALILGLDAGTLLGHGNADIQDFNCDVPVDDMVKWTGTLKINGVWTPGA